MKVVVLLDAEVDLALLASREGSWRFWFDAYLVDALRGMGHDVELLHFAPDVDATMDDPADVPPEPRVIALGAKADRFILDHGLAFDFDEHEGTTIVQVLALPFLIAREEGLDVEADFGELRFYAHGVAETMRALEAAKPDVVFNLTKHAFGARAWSFFVPLMLEALGLPYTGSGPLAEAVSINKALFKRKLAAHGIRTPELAVFPSPEREQIAPPVILKLMWSGGSEGLTSGSRITTGDASDVERAALAGARELHQPIVAERYIDGREVSIAVLQRADGLVVLPPGEWDFGTSEDRFITSKLKWDLDYCDTVGVKFEPAVVAPELLAEIEAMARAAFVVLGFRGYGNFDIRIDRDGRPYIVDANARPGLFPGSIRWKSVPFDELLSEIMKRGEP